MIMEKNFWKRKLWQYSHRQEDFGCVMPTLAIIAILVLLLLSSCATKTKVEYVDREVVKYETKIQHDTLINNVHDSIYHTIFQKGDTIYNTKYVEKIKYRDKMVYKYDTIYRDSTQVVVKENTIEKRIIPKWCYYSLFACGIFLIIALVKLIRWLR